MSTGKTGEACRRVALGRHGDQCMNACDIRAGRVEPRANGRREMVFRAKNDHVRRRCAESRFEWHRFASGDARREVECDRAFA